MSRRDPGLRRLYAPGRWRSRTGADGAPVAVDGSRSRRCARSGWSRTAGGRRSRCAATTSSWPCRRPRRRRLPLRAAAGAGTGSGPDGAGAPYVELHAHSAFSFLDGASTPRSWPPPPRELGYPALALTDHDGVWGSMEFAEACKGLGAAADHRRRADGGAPARRAAPSCPPHPAGRETQAGYRNLCRLLTAAHCPHPRQRRAAQRRPALGDAGAGRGARRGAGLPLRLRPRRGRWPGAWERGETGARRAARPAPARRLRARALPGRAAAALLAPRPRPQPLARRSSPSGSASPCVATGNVHSHDRRRARLQDAFVAVRLRRDAGGVRAAPARQPQLGRWPRRRRWRRASPSTPRRSPRPLRLAERLRFDLTAELGYRYPAPRTPSADRELAELCRGAGSPSATPAGRDRARGRARASSEELATIRNLGLSGFFLLHHDLLELAREVAVEVRGRDSARAVLPPGRGRGSSVSSIVCYLTGLSHIDPVKADLFSGRFLNEEVDRDARHRPRLPPRHPRGADPARARALRRRPLGPGRRLPHLPPARRRPRPRQGAGAAAERDRAGGEDGRLPRVGGRDRARRRRRDRRRARRRAALAGAARALRRGDGPAPPRLPALRRDGDLDRAADRRLPGRAGGDGGAPDRPVGQGLLRRRRLPQDRPAGAGDALRGRALRRRSRARRAASGSTSRGSRSTTRETFESIRAAETTGVFQIESRAQMQMLPRTLPREPRRPHRAGGAGAPRPDPGRRRPPLYRAAQAAARGPRATRSPTSTRRWSRCWRTRWARSSTRSR